MERLNGPERRDPSSVVVPWNGVDDTASLRAAIADAAYSSCKEVRLVPGRVYKVTAPISFGQQFKLVGNMGQDQGAEIHFYGAYGENCLQSASAGLSQVRIEGVRIRDMRTNPTSGCGIYIDNCDNGTYLDDLFVRDFPTAQIAVMAASGQSGDCIDMRRIWVTGSKSGAYGIYIMRQQNNINLDFISSDISGGGAAICIETIADDSSVISIRNVKHEPIDALTPTIYFPGTTKGNAVIESVIQRPQGSPTGGNSVVKYANASGGRHTLRNLTGTNHNTWGSGPCLIEDAQTGAKIWKTADDVMVGSSGRMVRRLAGNSIPNGAVYGNVGDTYHRLDATSTTCAMWLKRSGAASNTGWIPLSPETQSVSYAAALSAVNFNSGNRIQIGTLTGNITSMTNPTNVPAQGCEIVYEFTQDGTGGFTIAWSSLHKGSWPTGAGTAGQKKTVVGRSDSTNLIFVGDSGWY